MYQKSRKLLALLLSIVMLLALLPSAAIAADAHVHSYRLAADSYEATDTTGGYRHYRCTVCRADYAYETDPLVYTVNPKTGEALSQDYATNPYLPNYEFMPDNELHVFWSKEDSEWRVYAVGSHDTGLTGWCGNDITCWSAPVYDLSDWRFEAILRDTGRFFACDFNYDLQTDLCVLYAFPFFGNAEMSGTHLWTNGHSVPDTYFDTPLTEGDGVVGLDGVNHFDPAIYIAEDGTFLCTYDETTDGTKHAQLAMVNANDRTQVEWAVPIIMAEGEKNTEGYNPKEYEGSSIDVVEVDGHSYYVVQYSYKSNWSDEDYEKDVDGDQRWWPLAYVYSDPDMTVDELKDFTGWHWGGIIGDNAGFLRKDPGSDEVTEHDDPTNCWGNNHGSLVEINGQWYISNHRHTSDAAGRQGFLEKVSISADDEGKLNITPAEYTSSLGDSIDAYHTWTADIACHLWPTVFSETHTQTMYIDTPLRGAPANYWDMIYDTPEYAAHRSPVVGIQDKAEVGFKYLNFGDAAAKTTLTLLVNQGEDYVDGVAAVYLDAPNATQGKKLGTVSITADAIAKAEVKATGSDDTQWVELSADMDETVSGVHAVYFVFSSESEGDICKLDAFTFTKRFDDVSNESAYYYDAVYWATAHDPQITNGIDQTHFAPDASCTRAQAVTFLWRAAGCPAPKGAATAFADVDSKAYYANAVAWAVEKGITSGVSATSFAPNAACTRGQIVTFLWRFSGEAAAKGAATPFTDVAPTAFYAEAVAWAVENEVTAGTTATTFAPNAACTRGQIVTFLYRAMEGK